MDILTPRLLLRPLTPAGLDALLARDSGALAEATGLAWPDPPEAPPLIADALPQLRDATAQARAGEDPQWLFADRLSGEVVGMAGLGEAEAGTLFLGYSVYPAFEGQGYTTEAVRALVEWAFTRTNVERIEATIPPWHAASLRVAANVGMREVGTAHDDEVGEVLLFRIERR